MNRFSILFLFALLISACSEKEDSRPNIAGTTEEDNALAQRLSTTLYWDRFDTYGRVESESPEETAGYWYCYSDLDVGGNSQVNFPKDVEVNSYDNFFGGLIEANDGIKGEIVIGNAVEGGFAGIGFNVWSELQEGVDVSGWGGVCITYSSSVPFRLMLMSEKQTEKYYVDIPASNEENEVLFDWAAFNLDVKQTGKNAFLKNVAMVWLQFSESGNFLIQKIASLNACQK